HLLASDIPRFARLGVIASMQPYHAIDDGRWAEKRIGQTRIKTTYAFRSLLDTGAILVFGSDWYVAPLSPILGIHAAFTRETLAGGCPSRKSQSKRRSGLILLRAPTPSSLRRTKARSRSASWPMWSYCPRISFEQIPMIFKRPLCFLR